MASIYPRKNREGQLIGWQVAVRKRGYPVQTKTFDREADAKAWAAVIESEMIRGVYVDRSKSERTTLKDVIERYIEEVAPTHKGGKEEALRLKKILRDEPKLIAHSLAALTTRHFDQYRDRRLKEVGPGSVSRARVLCRSAATNGASQRSRSPCQSTLIDRPSISRPLMNHANQLLGILKMRLQ